MQTFNSSVISGIDYDPFTGTLTVEFQSGRVYDYHNVPYQVVQEFIHALSQGRYYNRNIKGRYE